MERRQALRIESIDPCCIVHRDGGAGLSPCSSLIFCFAKQKLDAFVPPCSGSLVAGLVSVQIHAKLLQQHQRADFAADRGDMRRGLAGLGFDALYFGPSRVQRAHAFDSAEPAGRQERRQAVFVPRFDVCTSGQQQHGASHVVLRRCHVQRRVEPVVWSVRVCLGRAQHCHRRGVPFSGSGVQRGVPARPEPEAESQRIAPREALDLGCIGSGAGVAAAEQQRIMYLSVREGGHVWGPGVLYTDL